MFMRLAINVATKDIPMDFTYCMDETFALHTPCSATTLEKEGTRNIHIVDKVRRRRAAQFSFAARSPGRCCHCR